MEFDLDGARVFAATGGRPLVSGGKSVVFLHGAGMDHTVWNYQARHFAHRGFAVLAPDCPGHGRSAGRPLPTVAALAGWTIRVLDALALAGVVLAGHSMGARVALEAAARLGGRVGGLALVGIAECMAVNPELRRAAEAGEDRAVDMILEWGFGERGAVGGNAAPGLWLKGHARRLLERALNSALGTDLAACDEERGAAEAAARVGCPAVVVSGANDRMTPSASAAALAERFAVAVAVEIPRCGHMCMVEEPAAVTAAIARIA
ncbi:MAG: alpha/beta hydrolase [Rhodospirillales bacterium]|nr:alpha/beta hydrolase [Rhodospirillales bacterium]